MKEGWFHIVIFAGEPYFYYLCSRINQYVMRIAHFLILILVAQSMCSQNSMSFNADEIRERGIYDIRDLTTVVPGLFVSSLGSAHTTAIYMRGIGSCTNTPSVGLYVDDVPWLGMSSLNSKIGEIERIEVLRGPQNTIYGRNAMGGLIRINTKNPFDYQGTVIERSMANHYAHYTSVSHYQLFSEKMGLTAGVAYRSDGQYFKNGNSGLKADGNCSLRVHTRLLYRPDVRSNIDFFANYELCSQDAFPFYLESIPDNDYFKDQLMPDVGRITSNDDNTYLRHLFNIGFKAEHNWSRVTLGNVLGFQLLNDDLKMDGDFTHLSICSFRQMQRSRTLSEEITLKNRTGAWNHWEWRTGVSFFYQWLHTQHDTPSNGVSMYHQSTLCDIFNAKGVDVTLGLRLEYDHASATTLFGKSYCNDWWHLMPHFSLQYSFSKGSMYGSISRGCRSGGYNCQISDVPSLSLYRPEFAWNYEVGTHFNFMKDRLYVDASVFLANISDMQIPKVVPWGTEVITRNTGRSRSFGGECSMRAQITSRLQAHASYGYTHATFTEYVLSSVASYKGNYVPLTPQHSVDLGANFTIPLPEIFNRQLLDHLVISSNWHGMGKIYWTEDNLVSDPFYSALDAKITFYRKHLEFGIWAANIYDSRCRTFYFQSMNRGYSQKNKPFQCGFEMKLNF